MILYDHPLSPYAQKVRIMLREKSLPFSIEVPDGLGSGEDTGYSAHNPRMEVPALVVGDTTLFDSTVILEYLEDAHPTPALRPADPLERARCRLIEEICDTHYEAINWGLGEIRFFGRGAAKADALSAVAGEETRAMQSWLEAQIGAGGWLSGDSFGWADLAAVPYVTMSQIFGFPPAEGSTLNAWLERVIQRPAVAETIGEAAASVAGMAHYSGLLEAGDFKRQFRDHRLEWLIRAGGIDVLTEGLERQNVRFTDLSRFGR
ncbi:glutathione S-transferase family protein [Novosphingobium percolationis]|uniref:glutathione S-transferase family protein n=1 Tax=Novosphingobium percolationis TaxID=2871811 RepID=UPI001CD5A834|nr:glutathione S-transferase family protein [Novosphingobium percolationis]